MISAQTSKWIVGVRDKCAANYKPEKQTPDSDLWDLLNAEEDDSDRYSLILAEFHARDETVKPPRPSDRLIDKLRKRRLREALGPSRLAAREWAEQASWAELDDVALDPDFKPDPDGPFIPDPKAYQEELLLILELALVAEE